MNTLFAPGLFGSNLFQKVILIECTFDIRTSSFQVILYVSVNHEQKCCDKVEIGVIKAEKNLMLWDFLWQD